MENKSVSLLSLIREDHVYLGFEADDRNDMLEKMSDRLCESGNVTEGFKDSIIRREAQFPTGLRMGEACFAIPHTDAEHVIESGVAVVQLKEPVEFIHMATTDDRISVRIVFILMLQKDGSQVELLKDIMEICSKPGFIRELEEAGSQEEVKRVISSYSDQEC